MKHFIILIVVFFITSCSDSNGQEKLYFDGQQICVDIKHIKILSSPNEGHSGFDKSSGMLSLSYESGDAIMDKFIALWGAPTGNEDSVSYSVMKLTPLEMELYNNHEMIFNAFNKEGSFKNAIVSELSPGFTKISREIDSYSWHVFTSPMDTKIKPQEQWVGQCVQYSKWLGCSFFYVQAPYLIEVRLAENYMLHKETVMKAISADLKDSVFCGKVVNK